MQLATAMLATDAPRKFEEAARYLAKQSTPDLAHLIEATWQAKSESFPVRDPLHTGESQGRAQQVLDGFARGLTLPTTSDHVVYAYMLENTRILEIFRRVMVSFFSTEIFNTPSAETLQWLDQTEQLFFTDGGPFSVLAGRSELRPDRGAVRRNLYHRMLGFDLNHGPDGKAGTYPYHRAEVANTRFALFFERLLEEVAVGQQHSSNSSGANPTDPFAIEDLVVQIRDAMLDRRGPEMASLAREEYVAVTFMSWLHLTISWHSPVVNDLRASASTATERLRRIGDRVRLPAHQDTRYFLDLGPDMSMLLRSIELNLPLTQQPEAFYTRGSALFPLMQRLIDRWSHVTGTNLRSRATRLDARTIQALSNAGAVTTSPAARSIAPATTGLGAPRAGIKEAARAQGGGPGAGRGSRVG